MAEKEDIFWIALILQRSENGLHLSSTGAKEAPDADVLIVESTGKSRLATGMGPRRGWNEVVVTDSDEHQRTGWVPWNGKEDDFWVIWDLGAYGPPQDDEHVD